MDAAELWDLYSQQRVFTGRTHIRGEELPDGLFHLVVHVWIKNAKGEYLISQRAASRPTYPLMWECVGGSVLAGETSIAGAIREAKEEVGIDLEKSHGKLLFTKVRRVIDGRKFNDIMDVWCFAYNGEISLSNATSNEVAQCCWMTLPQIRKLWDSGKMVETPGYFFDIKE